MKLLAISAFLVIFLFACVAVSAAPSIVFDKTEQDIGEVEGGKTVKVVFPFTNNGDEPLVIKSVNGSCGCTITKALATRIEPGESSSIEVEFKAKATATKARNPVTVNCNDPAKPTVELMVIGKVIPIVTFSPERLNLGTIKAGTTMEETVLVTPRHPEKFNLKNVSVAGNHLKVLEYSKTDDGKGTYLTRYRITAGETPGRVIDALILVTDQADVPTVPFAVYGNVESVGQSDVKSP
ncbi:MAG: DUF1573 domain-containing protein [Armatimonadota bacterium]